MSAKNGAFAISCVRIHLVVTNAPVWTDIRRTPTTYALLTAHFLRCKFTSPIINRLSSWTKKENC